jgi:hypothetical protein
MVSVQLFRKVKEEMKIKIVSIMLSLFIFGITPQGWAGLVKSIDFASNQTSIMKMDANEGTLLKRIETTKEPLHSLLGSLDKVISSFQFPQKARRDHLLYLDEPPIIKPSNLDLSQSALWPNFNENHYVEGGRLLTTFKSLQSKKEEIYKEIFKEIFMGFRFSFKPMSGHLFLDMNVTPLSERGTGLIISF